MGVKGRKTLPDSKENKNQLNYSNLTKYFDEGAPASEFQDNTFISGTSINNYSFLGVSEYKLNINENIKVSLTNCSNILKSI